LSNKSRTNCWKLYKASTDVVKTSNVCLNEINVIKRSDANCMLMKLKEDHEVVSLMKWIIIWIIKNQSVRD